jgi:hypothetical protein
MEDVDLPEGRKVLKLIGIESSSHDFNQTIYRTLDKDNKDSFWSSTGSESQNDNEFLVYRIKKGPALISSVSMYVYSATFQSNMPIYHPEKV